MTALGRIEPKNAVIKLTGPSYLYSGRVVPFLNAVQNVEISLSLNKELSQKEIRRKAEIILEEVGLGQQMYRNPNQLSGGQKQRVAIARALVKRGRGALSWGEVVTDLVLRPIENERGRAGLDTHVPLRFTASGASAARTGLFYCSPS
ncbi:MAG: ATP-binding cassette domain-containing protein [Nostoc sp.]|uniref:ATP-binding cassette domain-containing protein n=1 Tax=Nostoc sp. TaxID=1180 RepID=UPI002FFB444F